MEKGSNLKTINEINGINENQACHPAPQIPPNDRDTIDCRSSTLGKYEFYGFRIL